MIFRWNRLEAIDSDEPPDTKICGAKSRSEDGSGYEPGIAISCTTVQRVTRRGKQTDESQKENERFPGKAGKEIENGTGRGS